MPLISNINVLVQDGGSGREAIVSWDTDTPTTGVVDYGTTPAYEIGNVTSGTLATSHAVTLPALTPGIEYFYSITATDASLVSSFSGQQSFFALINTPPVPGSYSDEFNAPSLDPQWTFVDPVGDSSVAVTGTQLQLDVPAGVAHDIWTAGNDSARVTHPLPDEDFYSEVKLDTVPTQNFQIQGFLAQQDPTNFIRFDFYSNGTDLFVFAASFVSGTPTIQVNTVITGSTPIYLRVRRQADVWTQSYSSDGTNWTTAVSFTHPIAVSSAGIFAGNAGSSPPAYTALFDYYRIDQLLISDISCDQLSPGDTASVPLFAIGSISFDQVNAGDQSVIVIDVPVSVFFDQVGSGESVVNISALASLSVNQQDGGDETLSSISSALVSAISSSQASPGGQQTVLIISGNGSPSFGVIISALGRWRIFGMYEKKSACSEEPFTIDWSSFYTNLGIDVATNPITSSVWTVASGTAVSDTITLDKTTITLSGGVSGEFITAKNNIEINGGQYKDCATLYIRVF